MEKSIDAAKIYRVLDRLFWLIWIGFPVIIWLTYRAVLDQSALRAELPPSCADAAPQVANFSGAGKTVVAAYFIGQFLFYGILLALAHVTIHRFAKGEVFVSNTLRFLTQLGILVALWPFFDLAASNLLAYGIKATGDMKSFTPNFVFDVGPFGVGLLILTIRSALGRAIQMKQENDLTI
jgi:Protein of unknown function (DUF2975)